DSSKSILDELCEFSGEDTGKVRDVLAGMLFKNDEVFKSINVLSGGELARVAVAKLMLTRCNILLLDEPTNHLDIPSKEIFEQAIRDFEGTVITVSHDRYLLSNVCDCILYIKNRKGYFYDMPYEDAVKLFPGTEEEREKPRVKEEATKKDGMSKNEIFRAEKRVAELEQKMAQAEEDILRYEEIINGADFYKDAASSADTLKKYNALLREKDAMEEEWIDLTYRLENAGC
ncbi:MAG: ABC-F family ATP-binding cassette domain-containing protein, partial [Eubacteriaceae bacterium]|nr:ABC-F family ATP-binding cassette domain-containing protein [Eubacteriaceae bacterium]